MRTLFPVIVVAALTASAVFAEDQRNTVTVTGQAEVKCLPDTAVLSFTVTGSSEGAVEAEKKHADKLRRVKEALTKAGVKEGEISTDAVNIQTGVTKGDGGDRWGGGGGGGDAEMPKISVSSSIRIVLKGLKTDARSEAVRKVAAVLDAALEAGVDNTSSRTYDRYRGTYIYSSNNPRINYELDEGKTAEAREKATALALDDARRKAAEMARVLGRKIGKATTVFDQPRMREEATRSRQEEPRTQTESSARIAADALQEITIQTEIMVAFELTD